MRPLTKEQERRRKMVALYPRTHGPAPDRYRASARWWRLHAEESANPKECLGFADNQDRLYSDMLERPNHYKTKPIDLSDFQWSQQ
jgi:hypothetical protein